MNDYTDGNTARLTFQRERHEQELRRAQKAHALAVLDHMTAYVRAACSEAAYVEFAYYGSTRTLDVRGVLGVQPSPLDACPWLWDGSDEEHPLTDIGDDVELDLQVALDPYDSPAWATVRRNSASDGNSWLLELPPPDRAARIAELVRGHYPEATGIIVDGRAAGGRVLEVVEGESEDGTSRRTQPRRWPGKCGETITRLVAQIFALPSLAERHLKPLQDYDHPYGSRLSDLVRLMPLPPTS